MKKKLKKSEKKRLKILKTIDGLKNKITAKEKKLSNINVKIAVVARSLQESTFKIDINSDLFSDLSVPAISTNYNADFAVETSELSKQQILSQAATAMLAQANVSKQAVMALLR